MASIVSSTNSSAVFDIAALLLALAAFLIIRSWSRQPRKPPGPPALPFVGHLHLLGDLPHRSLHNLAKRYGPLMWLRLVNRNAIVASSPQMAKQILGIHDMAFASRTVTAVGVHLLANCSNLAFTPYGPIFKLLRHLFAREMFSSKRLAEFKPVRTQEIRSLVPLFIRQGDCGKRPVTVRPNLMRASHNITCRMIMGSTVEEICGADGNELLDAVDEVIKLMGVFNIGDYIPWLNWLDLQGYVKHMDAVAVRVQSVMQKVIDARRATRAASSSPPENPDLLDKMLEATEGNQFNATFTDTHIIANTQELLIGGSDTTPVTIEWALAELLSNPITLHKAQHEIDTLIGHTHMVDESDIPNLPYLGAIIKETMRLHPPAPLLVPHMSSQEVHMEGFVLPPNTIAYVNVWSLGRDPNTWDKPDEFYPERFLDSDIDTNGKHFELLPFGAGRRGCPGRSLGILNTHLMLATLLHAFNWSMPIKSQEIDMSEEYGITVHMKKSLNVIATPRLPKDLYTHESII